MTNYYEHIADFGKLTCNIGTHFEPKLIDISPKDNDMPSDVKRIFKHCDHEYNKRYYFLSESAKCIYRFYPTENGGYCSEVYHNNLASKKSDVFYLIPDSDRGTKETNYRDKILLSARLLDRVKNMNKIELDRMRVKRK